MQRKFILRIVTVVLLITGLTGCLGNKEEKDKNNTSIQSDLQGMYRYKDEENYIIVDFNTREDLDYPAFYIYNRVAEINEYGSFDENDDGSITIHSDHYEGYTGTIENNQLTITDGKETIELEKQSDTVYYITD